MTATNDATVPETPIVSSTAQGTFYRAAKECYKRGIPVIPIPPKEKGTRLTNWQNLASTDPEQLGKWKKPNPDQNAGAVAKNDGVCIVDWDETSLIKNLPQPLPKTFTVQSAKGLHSYFNQTDCTRALGNKNVADPKDSKHHLFDFQQHNKYVVAPNSIHPSGAVYTIVDDSPIAVCPDWLVEWMKGKAEAKILAQKPESQPKRGIVISKYGEPVTKDQFENWLTLHGEVFKTEPEYIATEQRWKYIRADRCPWESEHTNKNAPKDFAVYFTDEGKPQTKCAHSHSKQWSDYRDFLVQHTGHNFSMKSGKVLDETPPEQEPEKSQEKREKQSLSIGSFSRPAVPGTLDDYVINPLMGEDDGWFPRSDLSIIGGPSGSGKSTFMIDLLIKQRHKESVFGHGTKGLPFLVIMADRGEFAHLRTVKRMKIDPAAVPIRRLKGQGQTALQAIKEAVESCPELPAVVFLEGADMLLEDPNKMNIVSPFIDELTALARHYHLAIIASLGSPKMSSKDFYTVKRDQLFGSVAWGRKSETIVILGYEKADDTSAHRCAAILLRNGPSEKFDLIFEHGKLVMGVKQPELNDDANWMLNHPDWFSAQDVADNTGTYIKTVRKRIAGFMKAGILSIKEVGKNHKKMYIVKSVLAKLEAMPEAGGVQ